MAAGKLNYITLYQENREHAAQARSLLSSIPQDASVRASTFFLPQLSTRDEIYLSHSRHPADYIVVDLREGYEKDLETLLEDSRKQGYETEGTVEGYVAVLYRGFS